MQERLSRRRKLEQRMEHDYTDVGVRVAPGAATELPVREGERGYSFRGSRLNKASTACWGERSSYRTRYTCSVMGISTSMRLASA